jgi:hypothetical protein
MSLDLKDYLQEKPKLHGRFTKLKLIRERPHLGSEVFTCLLVWEMKYRSIIL